MAYKEGAAACIRAAATATPFPGRSYAESWNALRAAFTYGGNVPPIKKARNVERRERNAGKRNYHQNRTRRDMEELEALYQQIKREAERQKDSRHG